MTAAIRYRLPTRHLINIEPLVETSGLLDLPLHVGLDEADGIRYVFLIDDHERLLIRLGGTVDVPEINIIAPAKEVL